MLLLVLWQGVTHHRHVPFFAILVAFWLPRALGIGVAAIRPIARESRSPQFSAEPFPARLPVWLPTGVMAGAVVLATLLMARLQDVVVDRGEYPVTAVQFIKSEVFTGRMVVTFNWAQYAIAALCVSDTAGDPRRGLASTAGSVHVIRRSSSTSISTSFWVPRRMCRGIVVPNHPHQTPRRSCGAALRNWCSSVGCSRIPSTPWNSNSRTGRCCTRTN